MTISDNDIKTVTLVGSTRFPDLWIEAMRNLTLDGNIVHTVGLFGHQEDLDMKGPTKKMLDRIYLKKIYQSDAIFVLNKDDYIGMGAWDEIFFAIAHGKEIIFLEPLRGALKDDFLEVCRLEGWDLVGISDTDSYEDVYSVSRISPCLFDVVLKNRGLLNIRDFRTIPCGL